MQQVIAEETEELEIQGQIIRFPQLKFPAIESSSRLQCFYSGKYKLEFPSLKSLKLAKLALMNRFSGFDCSAGAFFSEKIDFPVLEELHVINDQNHVKRLWDQDISTIEGGKTVFENHVPMLRNLTISALPKLEELWVGQSNSLKELFEPESSNVASTANMVHGQLKALHLFTLPGLNQLPLDQFKGLCLLHFEGLSWEYVISADLLIRAQGSLQQLEVLEIFVCHKMRVVILDDVEGGDDFFIEFPRLKQITIGLMNTLEEFSSAKNAILRLPSLDSLKVKDCEAFKQFSSGPIIAPCLKILHLLHCSSLECFSSSHPNETLRLPSLELVHISQCDILESFSLGQVEMPKLREVCLSVCPKMQWFLSGSLDEDVVLNLPCLETLEIRYCENMEAFSFGPLMAANLSYVTYDWNKYSLLQVDGLNQFLKSKKKEIVEVYVWV